MSAKLEATNLSDVDLWQVATFIILGTVSAPWFWFVFVAILGGLAALSQMDMDPNVRFTFSEGLRKILNRTILSIFIGIMIWLCAEGVGQGGSPFARATAGIASFYGIKSVDYLAGTIRKFLEIWLKTKGIDSRDGDDK